MKNIPNNTVYYTQEFLDSYPVSLADYSLEELISYIKSEAFGNLISDVYHPVKDLFVDFIVNQPIHVILAVNNTFEEHTSLVNNSRHIPIPALDLFMLYKELKPFLENVIQYHKLQIELPFPELVESKPHNKI